MQGRVHINPVGRGIVPGGGQISLPYQGLGRAEDDLEVKLVGHRAVRHDLPVHTALVEEGEIGRAAGHPGKQRNLLAIRQAARVLDRRDHDAVTTRHHEVGGIDHRGRVQGIQVHRQLRAVGKRDVVQHLIGAADIVRNGHRSVGHGDVIIPSDSVSRAAHVDGVGHQLTTIQNVDLTVTAITAAALTGDRRGHGITERHRIVHAEDTVAQNLHAAFAIAVIGCGIGKSTKLAVAQNGRVHIHHTFAHIQVTLIARRAARIDQRTVTGDKQIGRQQIHRTRREINGRLHIAMRSIGVAAAVRDGKYRHAAAVRAAEQGKRVGGSVDGIKVRRPLAVGSDKVDRIHVERVADAKVNLRLGARTRKFGIQETEGITPACGVGIIKGIRIGCRNDVRAGQADRRQK